MSLFIKLVCMFLFLFCLYLVLVTGKPLFFFICLLICLIVCLLGVDSFLLSTVDLSSLCSGVYDLEFLILLSLPPNYYFSFLLTSGIIVCLLT